MYGKGHHTLTVTLFRTVKTLRIHPQGNWNLRVTEPILLITVDQSWTWQGSFLVLEKDLMIRVRIISPFDQNICRNCYHQSVFFLSLGPSLHFLETVKVRALTLTYFHDFCFSVCSSFFIFFMIEFN